MGAAQSIHRYRDPGCSLRTILPNVCTRLDSIRAVGDGTNVNAAVDYAFPGHLDADTFTAINTRYPELGVDCTSDKRLLNKVATEAHGTDIRKYCHKHKKWIVNCTKLSLSRNGLVCLRSHQTPVDN